MKAATLLFNNRTIYTRFWLLTLTPTMFYIQLKMLNGLNRNEQNFQTTNWSAEYTLHLIQTNREN